MSFILNPNYTPFCDKKGNYVEVIAVLPSKIIVLYSVDNTEDIKVSNSSFYKVGDKLYIKEDGYATVESIQLETTSTRSNKQSPSSIPLDPFARYSR